ncbi:hypothetical protein A2U01_0111074, partial [Trifolium medium]|nr:hypothetical protein [Trifolium medium]
MVSKPPPQSAGPPAI